MIVKRFWVQCAWSAILFAASGTALCADDWPPASVVCVQKDSSLRVVDREKLAAFLLDQKPSISWRAFKRASAPNDGPFAELSPEERLIVDTSFCPQRPSDPDNPECSSTDRDLLANANVTTLAMLRDGSPAYHARGNATTPDKYFLSRDTELECLGASSSGTHTADDSSPKDAGANPFRFRGTADGLYYRRTSDGFKSVDKAQVGFSDDEANNKRTDKIVGVAGYAFVPMDENGNVVQLVPYIGINRNLTDVEGKATSYTADTRDVGVMFAVKWPGTDIGPSVYNVVSLRPDFLWNNRDQSRLLTLNARYIPFVGNLLNAPINGDAGPLAVRTVADVRLDQGHYTTTGRAPTGTLENYVRFGGQVGLGISTREHAAVPIDLTLTETALHGFDGSIRSLHYFKSVISIGFDENKDFSLDLGYTNGRREDTGEREQGWSVGIGAKY